jgi:hypothetical protein
MEHLKGFGAGEADARAKTEMGREFERRLVVADIQHSGVTVARIMYELGCTREMALQIVDQLTC